MNLSSLKLTRQLLSLEGEKFTGKLEVRTERRQWIFYLVFGRVVWADGGDHPHRSWQRHLKQYFSQVKFRRSDLFGQDRSECWNYRILTGLARRKTIEKERVISLINSKIIEVSFDVLQQETKVDTEYQIKSESVDYLSKAGLKQFFNLLDAEPISIRAEQTWLTWCQRGFAHLSPNLVPRLKRKEKLFSKIDRNLFESIDGRETLRDLAIRTNSDLLQLTGSLFDFIERGWIELIEVPDGLRIETEVDSLLESGEQSI